MTSQFGNSGFGFILDVIILYRLQPAHLPLFSHNTSLHTGAAMESGSTQSLHGHAQLHG